LSARSFNFALRTLLVLIAAAQVSCGGPYVQTTGVDFDPTRAAGFENTTTSKEDVRIALGEPQETRVTNDGLEIWVYRYEVMERLDDGMMSGAGFKALLREKRLEVIFAGDKLRHTAYIEAKSPIERQTLGR
jgi:hypothetical protein